MTAGDDELGGIVWVGRAEGAGVAHDAGIKLAVDGAHGELEDRAMGSCGDGGHFESGGVRRAEDEVAVSIGRRQCAVEEFFGLDVAGAVGIAGRRSRIFGLRRLRCGLRCRGLCQNGHGERGEKDQAENAGKRNQRI
jgi:hypothetical protein